MEQIIFETTKFYLAFQDGPVNDIEYDTWEKANDALREMNDKSVCIQTRVHRKIYKCV